MSLSSLLQKAEQFALQPYQKVQDPRQLREGHVAFSGAPLQHPTDDDKILLIAEPYSSNPTYYAFRAEDVVMVERLPSISSDAGQIAPMARLWVKKGSIGLRHVPFLVEDMTPHTF